MSSILNFTTSSSFPQFDSLTKNSLFSNLKLPTTFIIQPPSSTQAKTNSLLTKRHRAAELGDLLMKKIKSQTLSSGNNSNVQSPINKENSGDNIFEDQAYLESTSIIEEIPSPSTKSFCDDSETQNHKMLEGSLIPQRSISTPLVFSSLIHGPYKMGITDSHKQVQHALDVLQKKIMIEQQAACLREILLKNQMAQEPLVIPPLRSTSNSTHSSAINQESKNSISDDEEDGQEIIYGPIEYPLLSMLNPSFGESIEKKNSDDGIQISSTKTKSKSQKKNKFEAALLDSLCPTRSETLRSESDMSAGNKRKYKKRAVKNLDMNEGKKSQKKCKSEQIKKRQQKNDNQH